jgi:uncharacterized protein (DUF302 family)
MKRFSGIAWLALSLLVTLPALAADRESLLMVRSTKPFAETLDQLSAAINYSEYKISRIQRVDVGLTDMGFKTEKYRLVFFAKPAEIDRLAAAYPELIPFIPLKLVIFSEGNDTLLLVMNPHELRKLVPNPKLYPYFSRWETDVRKILASAIE